MLLYSIIVGVVTVRAASVHHALASFEGSIDVYARKLQENGVSVKVHAPRPFATAGSDEGMLLYVLLNFGR
jgi:hypothetical protein